MNMRQSHTAVVERNQCWEGDFITEPYEVALRRLAAPSRNSKKWPRLGTRPSGAQGMR